MPENIKFCLAENNKSKPFFLFLKPHQPKINIKTFLTKSKKQKKNLKIYFKWMFKAVQVMMDRTKKTSLLLNYFYAAIFLISWVISSLCSEKYSQTRSPGSHAEHSFGGKTKQKKKHKSI